MAENPKTPLREIILDTETTGFDPKGGDRIVEIGCVEMIDKKVTDNHYHQYINPMRDMPKGAYKVHGLSEEFLRDFPTFKSIAHDFMEYVKDSPLVIHNAKFDMKFLIHELAKVGIDFTSHSKKIIDTLEIARLKFPGEQASLDALCRKYGIDSTNRALHGALIDADLLAKVYLCLEGNQQENMTFTTGIDSQIQKRYNNQSERPYRVFDIPSIDLEHHKLFIEKNIKNSLWGY